MSTPNVYRDTKSGSWLIDFHYTDEHGIRRRYKRSAGRGVGEKDARQRARDLYKLLERDRRAFVDTFVAPAPKVVPVAFGALAARWYAESVEVRCRPSTQRTHAAILRTHLVPFLGEREIRGITPGDVTALLARLKRGGASDKTANNVLSALSAVLDFGIKPLGLLASNVVREVPPLKVRDQGFTFLGADQAREFLRVAAAIEPRFHTLFQVALLTGLRQGELLALQWDAVDLEHRQIVVRRALSNGVLGAPKSGRTRVVPLSDEVVAALAGARHQRGPFVFCTEDGRPLTGNVVKNPFRRVARAAGFPTLSFHGLRHSFASVLAAAGTPLQAISTLLGHSEIKVTTRYAHLAPSASTDAVQRLGAAVTGIAAK